MTADQDGAVVPAAPRRALVVDDAPTVRMYHGGILRQAGFDVDEAVNGFEALEMLLAGSYALLLVDVNMPQMDGYTLVQRLRSAPVSCAAPVVTISTESGDADAEAAYRAGANLYLVKPVAPDALSRTALLLTSDLPAGTPGDTPAEAPTGSLT